MIKGSGRVCLLSGQIRRYRVGFPLLHGCTPGRPLGRGVDWLGRAGYAWEKASWPASGFRPIRLGKIENHFSFSIFYKFQTNLNSNQILISTTSSRTIKYKSTLSHNKICNDMNATNIIIYLRKWFAKIFISLRKSGCYKPTPLK
jgi:hypothetical protein